MNNDVIIPRELMLKICNAQDDMLGADWTDAVLRKIASQTPADSELGRALSLIRERVRKFNQDADAAWRKAKSETERLRRQHQLTQLSHKGNGQ